jgi:hypothetical protein
MSGKWLVESILHQYSSLRNYIMKLTLVRDSVDYDVNAADEPESIFDDNKNDIY